MADYGATLAGVRRLLPELTIDETTRPSAGDVEAWLNEFTGEVARRLGDLSGLSAEELAEVDTAARRLVHWAVAATTYDAHHPERAGTADTSYGSVLWTRYREGLDELDSELGGDEEGDGGSGAAAGSPVGHFPEPAFPDDDLIYAGP